MKQLILLLIIITCFKATSQVKVNASVNKNTVTVNEVFSFELTSNSNCSFTRPVFNGLQIIQGPFQSSSSQSTIVNGQRTFQKEYKFSYRLRALKEGTYTIAALNAECNGINYSTKSITVKVVKSNINTSNITTNSDFFVRIHSSKLSVYQGEPFTLTMKMYSRSMPQQLEQIEFGESKGLWRKDLNPNQSNFSSDQEIINGVRFYSTTIRRELCYAQTSGEISIEKGFISAVFRKNFFQSYKREAKSNNLKIKVKPLPDNAPKNFNGLVGKLKLNHEISKTELKPGEAIDLKLKISGKGNLNIFDSPTLKIPNDFEKYDPEIKNNIQYKSSGINGSISYNYVIVPTFYGDYIIPAYSFSYFDIDSKTYKTLSTGEFNIHVEKTENSLASPDARIDKKELDIQKEDIRHHQNIKNLFSYDSFLISKLFYLILLGLPFIVLIIMYYRRKKLGLTDQVLARSKRDTKKKLIDLLIQSKSNLSINNDNEAIKNLQEYLTLYLQDKLSLNISDLEINNIIEQLNKRKINQEFIEQLKLIWQTISLYQYAPINANKVDQLIKQAEELTINLDKTL